MGTSMPKTTTQPVIRFSVAAAADALARADQGEDPRPGDDILIAHYEGYCQQEWDRHQDAVYAAEREAWLSTRCPGCEPGGSGAACDEHYEYPICVFCGTTQSEGTCCTSHRKHLCHGCYRRTHFVELCVASCELCAAEGLDPGQPVPAKAAS